MPVNIPYLPKNPDQWKRRIRELIAEMRRPDLTPCSGFLYRQDAAGNLSACIEGVINEMAIRNGLPALWVEMDIEGDDAPITIWEVEPPTPDGAEPTETSNTVLMEALLYHGSTCPMDTLPSTSSTATRPLSARSSTNGTARPSEPTTELTSTTNSSNAAPTRSSSRLTSSNTCWSGPTATSGTPRSTNGPDNLQNQSRGN